MITKDGHKFLSIGNNDFRAILRIHTYVKYYRIAIIYTVVSIPIIFILNILFVPFHVPDDYEHLKRAYSLIQGDIFPLRHPGELPTIRLDSGLSNMIDYQFPIVKFFDNRISLWDRMFEYPKHAPTPEFRWSHELIYSDSGAGNYLPIIYVPQAIGLEIGQVLDLSVNSSVFVARLLNGLTTIIIIYIILTNITFGHGLLLTILFLPKTLLHIASNSADPLIHALTLLIIVFSLSGMTGNWTPRLRHYILISVSLLTLVGVRPPLMPIAVLPLATAAKTRSVSGVFVVAVGLLLAVAWTLYLLPHIADPRCGVTGSFATKALAFVTEGPKIITETLRDRMPYYTLSFIGELGHGNGPDGYATLLPGWIYPLAVLMMILAAGHDIMSPSGVPAYFRLLAVFAALAATGLIFFAMYGGCTAEGGGIIRGVQGRYFVTAFLLAAPAISGLRPTRFAPATLFLPCLLIYAFTNFITLSLEGYRIYGWG